MRDNTACWTVRLGSNHYLTDQRGEDRCENTETDGSGLEQYLNGKLKGGIFKAHYRETNVKQVTDHVRVGYALEWNN